MIMSPVAVLVVALYASEKALIWGGVALVASCGGSYVLSRAVRDAGKRLQDELFKKWGGAPVTQLLRHRDQHFDAHTKERFHKALSKGLGKKMPTAASETADPAAADELYRAAAVWMINQTRDAKRFPLVFKENVAFGFHRNSVGVRGVGITIAALTFIWCAIQFWMKSHAGNADAVAGPGAALVYSGLMLATWAFILNERAVKRAGFAYAERLIQSLDLMKAQTATRTRSTKE